MNHMLWPTALIAILLFWLGIKVGQKVINPLIRNLLILLATVLAVPGILFAAYYTKLLGEPIWLYEFRSWPETELTAGGLGLILGLIHQLRHKHPFLQRQLRVATVPVILAVMLAVPYLKPVVRPLDIRQLQERWQDGVCIQSTPSTCGPLSAATILRLIGKNVTEAELARDSFTYAGGTENWYLARALRKRGCIVEFRKVAPGTKDFPTPSIAGVKIQQGSGHFIALTGRDGANYIGGDPLGGKFSAPLSELKAEYTFTGFFLIIK